jgi:hypothetical protein
MVIERVQSPNPERRSSEAVYPATPARSKWNLADGAAQDRVVVSDQARQLAAVAGKEQGSGLQLDFRKLRELAFPTPSRDGAPADSAEYARSGRR